MRIKRPALAGAAISLAIHLLALYLLSREDLFSLNQPPPELTQPMSVRLVPLPGNTAPVAIPPTPVKPAAPPAPRPSPRKPPRVEPVTPPAGPDVFAVTRPQAPATPPPAPSKPQEPAPLDPSQFPDMISYLEAVRQKRRAAGEIPDASGEPPAAPSARTRQDAEDAARMARIQRNLQQPGTNGIFHISSIDARSATFSFRGWRGEYSYSRREEYQVEAGFNQDIRRLVVRKMIEIIRRYHTEDFNWESPRLERVVVLSARLQDNDGLEDFLIQEFFGAP